ncbi:putative ribonuclease H-like domain-containing protein [Tanacetum coccineum]
MPLSTYLNLGLGKLAHTKLTVELADRTVKYPKGIAENVLVGIGKFVFPVDFIILDMPKDVKVPLILGRLFVSTSYAKIDVFKRKITLRVGDEKIIFKSMKPANSLIKRVYMLGLREHMELDFEARLMRETLSVDGLMTTIEEGEVIDDPMIDIIKTRNNESFDEEFYNSIMKDKLKYKGKNVVGAFMNVPIFVRKFSVVTHFVVVENMNGYRDQDIGDIILGEPFCKASCVEARRFLHMAYSSLWIRCIGPMTSLEKKSTKLVKNRSSGILCVRSRGSDFDIPVVFSLVIALLRNKTLIEAARTMLADSFLPNTFWAEAVSTACYVLNRVLVTKPQNKTPYELITGKIPIISYIRPFGCHVTILNTIDHLGKFDGKSDEGFLVGYSLNSKAFRVYNLETKRVEENLHITFLENKPNVAGKGPNWLFDLDYLTDSMNYQPVRSENQANKHAGPKEANHSAGTQDNIDAGNSEMEAESAQDYFVLPIWSSYTSTVKSSEAKNEGEKSTKNTDLKTNEKPVDQEDQAFLDELERLKRQEKEANDAAEALRKEFAQNTKDLLLQAGAARASSTNTVNTASTPVSTASPSGGLSFTHLTNTDQDDSEIPDLEDSYDNPNDGIFTNASYDDEGAVADFTNLETIVNVSPIPTSRINSIHPSNQILGDPKSAVQTRSKVNKSSRAYAFMKVALMLCRKNCCNSRYIKVWILVDLPYGKKAIGTKWVYRNKKDERGVVVINKARLVAQGHRQEEGIDYDEVFAPVARIESIRIFLAFASYMGFIVYQMDVNSAFLYVKIDEDVYVSQPPRTASTPIENQKPLTKEKKQMMSE